MSSDLVRFVAAVLVIILTTSCGSSLEGRRPEEPIASAQGLDESRVVFIPAKPRAQPGPSVDQAQLVEFLRTVLPEAQLKDLDAEWHRIVSDPRFRSLRAERPKGQYRIVLASWSAGDSRLEAITRGYRQWCGFKDRRSRCIPIPPGQRVLTDAEVYKIAFDFMMGAQWDGFIRELKGTISPATLRIVLLTGLVVFMACLAMPELTSKIPVAIATAVLTAYLGAQAVCDLVFGWFRMIREVEAATSFEQVQAAGERYGVLIGAETARVLIMLAMAALSEGGVIARLMKLPKIAEASAALAVDTEGAVKSVAEITGAKVVQGEAVIAADGVAQGAVGVAMVVRGGAPRGKAILPSQPPQKPVDIRLTYKQEWTPQQRADARAKVKMLNETEGKVVIKKPLRELRNARSKFMKSGSDIPPDCDLDHCVDLQLNGKDSLENLWPLDSSVNRSLGSQIHQAIKDLPAGTPIGSIIIE